MVREIEPWSLTKSDLTNFSPFQTILGKKQFFAKIFLTQKNGAKKVIWPIFSPFQSISGIIFFANFFITEMMFLHQIGLKIDQ